MRLSLDWSTGPPMKTRHLLSPRSSKSRYSRGGTPTVSVSSPGDRFLADLARWASMPHGAAIPADERLRTAIELYSASFAESSRRARFLTLVMVLEVLSEDQ